MCQKVTYDKSRSVEDEYEQPDGTQDESGAGKRIISSWGGEKTTKDHISQPITPPSPSCEIHGGGGGAVPILEIVMTEHIKDPVPLIEKSRASCPGGRFPRFIHQVIIITGLNRL